MSRVIFSSDITVKLVRACTADEFVVQTAQVSAKGETDIQELIEKYEAGKIDIQRFINALMKGRHGSPFEHNLFTFFVKAPLFVFREWQRHRISSFNEMSGRYTEMLPEFYITPRHRKMVNMGTKMKPRMQMAPLEIYEGHIARKKHSAQIAWDSYQSDLAAGIANEVAREDLPLHTYSQMYWSANARSLMNFLSLRVESDDSLVRSYPQWEIQMGAEKVEEAFRELMPATHKAFVANGRVAP